MNHMVVVASSLLCAGIIGCSPTGKPSFSSGSNINFYYPQVGQMTRYVSFTIADDSVKTYGRDTAVVEVTDTLGTGFVFSANFSPRSQSYMANLPGPRYSVQIRNDSCKSILLDGNNIYLSQLLPPNNFPLSFKTEGTFAFNMLTPSTCNTVINHSLNHISFDGTVTSCMLSGYMFDTLSIVIDHSGLFSTGNGYACIFSKGAGFLYTMSYMISSNSKTASGWEILPYQ
jgi:hypothetical protein